MSLCGSVALTRGRRKRARYTCLGAFFCRKEWPLVLPLKVIEGYVSVKLSFKAVIPFYLFAIGQKNVAPHV